MAKKKQPKKPVGFIDRIRSLKKDTKIALSLVLIALVAGIAWHEIHTEIQFRADKNHYGGLEESMKDDINSIQKNVGNAYELNHSQGCSYIARKFEKGRLNCNNYYTFSYQVTSISQAKSLTTEMLPFLKSKARGEITYHYDNLNSFEMFLSGEYINVLGFNCMYQYEFESRDTYNQILNAHYQKSVHSQYVAKYTYSCGGYPTKALYPIEKQL